VIPNWVKERIGRGNAFVVSSHINPDADGAGSAAAMAWFLTKLGKRASVVNAERLPPAFRFLESVFPVASRPSKADKSADAWFVLDSSKRVRAGLMTSDMPADLLCIDHHYDNEYYGRENWVDAGAPATSELIYSLIRSYGLTPDLPVAEALYAGVLVDTGGFKFSNTSERAFSMCAELMRCGVDSQKMYKTVFLDKTLERIRLEGALLSGAEVLMDGRVCLMEVSGEILKSTGAGKEDLEGISNLTMCLRNIEVGLLFVRIGNKTKVCFRSNGGRNIRDVAFHFGGGGHAAAAGCVMDAAIPEARRTVLEKVAELLKRETAAEPADKTSARIAMGA
jgi:phosphoesterase RecJ-like protein